MQPDNGHAFVLTVPDENLCKQAFLTAARILAGARLLRISCVYVCVHFTYIVRLAFGPPSFLHDVCACVVFSFAFLFWSRARACVCDLEWGGVGKHQSRVPVIFPCLLSISSGGFCIPLTVCPCGSTRCAGQLYSTCP